MYKQVYNGRMLENLVAFLNKAPEQEEEGWGWGVKRAQPLIS